MSFGYQRRRRARQFAYWGTAASFLLACGKSETSELGVSTGGSSYVSQTGGSDPTESGGSSAGGFVPSGGRASTSTGGGTSGGGTSAGGVVVGVGGGGGSVPGGGGQTHTAARSQAERVQMEREPRLRVGANQEAYPARSVKATCWKILPHLAPIRASTSLQPNFPSATTTTYTRDHYPSATNSLLPEMGFVFAFASTISLRVTMMCSMLLT